MSLDFPRRDAFRRNFLIVISLLFAAGILSGVAVYIVVVLSYSNVSNVPLRTSQDFMSALVAKDYTKAYGMIHLTYQADFGGSVVGMEDLFTSKGIEPASFILTNVNTGEDAFVSGTGTFAGKLKYIYIRLRKEDIPVEGNNWKIAELDVNDNLPTATPTNTN